MSGARARLGRRQPHGLNLPGGNGRRSVRNKVEDQSQLLTFLFRMIDLYWLSFGHLDPWSPDAKERVGAACTTKWQEQSQLSPLLFRMIGLGCAYSLNIRNCQRTGPARRAGDRLLRAYSRPSSERRSGIRERGAGKAGAGFRRAIVYEVVSYSLHCGQFREDSRMQARIMGYEARRSRLDPSDDKSFI